jgi:predicted Na+-dependent transporter
MYIFHIIDYKSTMACCFLPWFGFIGGAVISLIGTRDRKKTIAICIETGIQNTAVAIFFLRLTFPQPESDVALANPILVSMAIPIPFIMLIIAKSIMKRFAFCAKFLPKKKDKNNKSIENGTKTEPIEKTLIKELLEETKEEEKQQQEQSGQIENTPI